MNLKALFIFLVLALMYVLTYYYKVASGLLFYYVQTITYTTIVFLTLSEARKYVKYSYFTKTLLFFLLSYLSVYMMLGFWSGFGLTPYSTSPTGVIINVAYVISKICALEFLRAYIIDAFKYRGKGSLVYISAITVWFLTWFPYPLLSFNLSVDGLKYLYRYLIPSLMNNVFSTFIIINYGIVPSIMYNVVPQLFVRLVPYLPKLDWFIEGAFNTLVPLIGYLIALSYSRAARISIKKAVRSEIKNTSRLIAFFATLLILIIISQGYIGVKLYVISSGSMEPALKSGDIVVICNSCGDIKPGDIIAYVSKFGVIIHRVIEINENQGNVITKGDANRDPDPEPVSFKNIIGKAVLRIPFLGYIPLLLYKFRILALALVFTTLILVTLCIFNKTMKYSRYY